MRGSTLFAAVVLALTLAGCGGGESSKSPSPASLTKIARCLHEHSLDEVAAGACSKSPSPLSLTEIARCFHAAGVAHVRRNDAYHEVNGYTQDGGVFGIVIFENADEAHQFLKELAEEPEPPGRHIHLAHGGRMLVGLSNNLSPSDAALMKRCAGW